MSLERAEELVALALKISAKSGEHVHDIIRKGKAFTPGEREAALILTEDLAPVPEPPPPPPPPVRVVRTTIDPDWFDRYAAERQAQAQTLAPHLHQVEMPESVQEKTADLVRRQKIAREESVAKFDAAERRRMRMIAPEGEIEIRARMVHRSHVTGQKLYGERAPEGSLEQHLQAEYRSYQVHKQRRKPIEREQKRKVRIYRY